MANVNAPFGFRPTMRTKQGGSGSIVRAHKLAAAAALYIHDAVTQQAAGTKNTRCIVVASSIVLGVNLIYGVASTETDHAFVTAQDAIFVCQGDGAASALTVDHLSYTANMSLVTGNTVTKVSKHGLKEDTINTTNTFDLKIRGLYEGVDNVAGQYAKVYVSFNNCADAEQKAGI